MKMRQFQFLENIVLKINNVNVTFKAGSVYRLTEADVAPALESKSVKVVESKAIESAPKNKAIELSFANKEK